MKRENLHRLDADIHNYQRQLVELDRKLELLAVPNASCPVCDLPLDENHWQHVLTNAQSERENIEVACEFCGVQYQFDPIDAAQLFAAPAHIVPGSSKPQ